MEEIQSMEAWVMKARELYQTQNSIKLLEATADKLKRELQVMSNGKDVSAGGFKYICEYRKGLVDYSRIPELKDIDLEQYRKDPVKYWKLSLELV